MVPFSPPIYPHCSLQPNLITDRNLSFIAMDFNLKSNKLIPRSERAN